MRRMTCKYNENGISIDKHEISSFVCQLLFYPTKVLYIFLFRLFCISFDNWIDRMTLKTFWLRWRTNNLYIMKFMHQNVILSFCLFWDCLKRIISKLNTVWDLKKREYDGKLALENCTQKDHYSILLVFFLSLPTYYLNQIWNEFHLKFAHAQECLFKSRNKKWKHSQKMLTKQYNLNDWTHSEMTKLKCAMNSVRIDFVILIVVHQIEMLR